MKTNYYKKGLEIGPNIDKEMFDLSKEIAFNISLIYSSSGNTQIARYYTEKYISV